MDTRPLVAVTMGDPAGVGPEICAKALALPEVLGAARIVVFGSLEVLDAARDRLGAPTRYARVARPGETPGNPGAVPVVEPVSAPRLSGFFPGRPTPETGDAMVRYILSAVSSALAGDVDAVATCPIHKAAMRQAGYSWPGHTEIFAEKCQAGEVVMMLAGDRLRVVLVTIHLALRDVPGALTTGRVLATIRVTREALRSRFGVPAPRLAVAGLNPHAGEGGLFGDEEARVILPAMDLAREHGVLVEGPFPPDTLFYHAQKGAWDAVVCMYHDQGLIPFKMLHFEDGVNTTLGLPIIRTSVDHGTAYDIAGTGQASEKSLAAAVRMAALQAACAARARP
jgi:4-hydroxythreonine-4-phosphate dehydrogenase